MNELPYLALLKIIGQLSISGQVKVRRLCKWWKNVADECLRSRTELIVFWELTPMPLLWARNSQPVDLNNSVVVNSKMKESDYFVETFKGVRSLFIAYHLWFFADGKKLKEFIGKFSGLKHFQLKDVMEYMERNHTFFPAELDSKSLQTLFLGPAAFALNPQEFKLNLNCPNLKKFSFYTRPFHMTSELNDLFRNLEFLKVNKFTYKPGSELPSLRVIAFCDSIGMNIDNFKSLKEIHYFYHRMSLEKDLKNRFLNPTDPRQGRQGLVWKLNGLLRQKRTKERNDLAIYYDGFLYRDDEEFRDYIVSKDNRYLGPLPYFMRNRISARHYPGWRNSADFISLLRNSKIENTFKAFVYAGHHREILARMLEEMDDESIERLSKSILGVLIEEASIEDLNELKFRELFKYGKYFCLADLPQDVLDHLPEIIPNVVSLCFSCIHSDVTNFRFLGRFKTMKTLYIGIGNLSLDELKAILDNCKIFLVELLNSTKETPRYSIQKDKTKWSLYLISEGMAKFMANFPSKEELLEHLDQIGLLKKHIQFRDS